MRSSAGFLLAIGLSLAPCGLLFAFARVLANLRWQRSHLDWTLSGLFVRSPSRSRGGSFSIRAAVPTIVAWPLVFPTPPAAGPSGTGHTLWYRMQRLGLCLMLSFAPAVGLHCSPRQSPQVCYRSW